ncbi:hypothetical protein [Corynebacterium auriscanis]|uniref:hypothetical protein n=1 Tax=Corynebacterium auriscanis TaxID=99807 RepID=UPI0022470D31|nr:hypothetical protein [Corynebacterium auriscanis]MCX2164017.1 hypothetical protein [Corynebacterium auriscanis]
MRNDTQPQWEEVASVGLTNHAYDDLDDNLPGALSLYCYRAPTTYLPTASFTVELENLHTGAGCVIEVNQPTLLAIARACLDAATRGVPTDCTPGEYFQNDGEVA